MHDPGGSSHKKFDWRGSYGDPANDAVHVTGGGHRRITSAIDKFRLNVSGGPVVTGTITLVGIRKTPVPATLPVFTGGQEIVEVQKITTSTAEVTFETGIDGTGHMYEIIFNGVIPVNDSAQLRLTMSEDGGSTWLAGVDYFGASWFGSSGATTGQNNQAGAAFFSLCNAVDNLAGSGAAGTVKIFNAPDAQYTHIVANSTYKLGSNTWSYVELKNGHIDRSNAIDGFRLTFDTGNIAEGEFVLVKHLRQGQETPLPRGHFYRDPANALFSANETDRDHDRGLVAPVHVRDSSDTVNMRLTTTMTKQIDAAWAQGDNAGGLFSGTVAASTTYYCHMIATTAGDVDWGWDTSPTAANKPAGWAYYRRLGSMRTNATSNLVEPNAVVVEPPTTGWTRFDSATTTGGGNYEQDGSVVLFQDTGTGSRLNILQRTAPTAPYTLTVRVNSPAYWDASAAIGIGVKDNATGELHTFALAFGATAGETEFKVEDWNTISAFNSTRQAQDNTVPPGSGGFWLRIRDDNTNLYYEYSFDGTVWIEVTNHARAVFLTPDRIFLMNKATQPGARDDHFTICNRRRRACCERSHSRNGWRQLAQSHNWQFTDGDGRRRRD
jgi:hypothetical protein